MNLPPLMSSTVAKMLIGVVLAALIWQGCAVAPVTPVNLTIKDTDRKFAVDTIIATQTRSTVIFEELLADLEQVGVVFVGEVHDNGAHHQIQARLVQALTPRQRGTA